MTSSSQARIRPNALDGGSTRIEKAGRAVILHTECCGWVREHLTSSSTSCDAIVGVRKDEVSSNYMLNEYFLFVGINILCELTAPCLFGTLSNLAVGVIQALPPCCVRRASWLWLSFSCCAAPDNCVMAKFGNEWNRCTPSLALPNAIYRS